MDLDFAVLADGAMTRPEGKFDIIGAGFDTIFAVGVPARHARFVLVLRLLLSAEEAELTHELAAELRGPDGAEVAVVGGQVPELPHEYREQVPPEVPLGLGIVLNFENTVFPAYGDYRLSVTWDGSPLRTPLPIRVTEQPRPEQRS
jgi:hypothetical protein